MAPTTARLHCAVCRSLPTFQKWRKDTKLERSFVLCGEQTACSGKPVHYQDTGMIYMWIYDEQLNESSCQMTIYAVSMWHALSISYSDVKFSVNATQLSLDIRAPRPELGILTRCRSTAVAWITSRGHLFPFGLLA